MKSRIFVLVFFFMSLISCTRKEAPFKPNLERVILELRDSLKGEIGNDKLLSIVFYYPNRLERGCEMKIFISDWYNSATIDGFAKIRNTTIAIYNLKDDACELVNKNAITFFIDTISGFRDSCVWEKPERQYLFSIYPVDSIVRSKFTDDFPFLIPLRRSRQGHTVSFKVPKNLWFHVDSIQAEKDVEYYRTRGRN